MYFYIYEASRASSSPRNKSIDLTWLFSDSEIARELGPDMVPPSWESSYENNRRMCTLMSVERRQNKKLDKASAGIPIRLCFTKVILHS